MNSIFIKQCTFFLEQSKEDEQAVTHNEIRGMNEKFVNIL